MEKALNYEQELLGTTLTAPDKVVPLLTGILSDITVEFDNLIKRYEEGQKVTGLKTVEHVDNLINGLQTGLYILVGNAPSQGKTASRGLTKEVLRNAELGRKRKGKEEWQVLAEKIGKQRVGEIRGSLKKLADLYGSYWLKWKKLESIAPEAVYKEWWEEDHDKPIGEALNRLELKVRGRECRARGCDNVFVPKRSDHVYCSENCRTRAFHQRKRASLTGRS